MNLITSRKPVQIRAWLESLRPKTLPLGIAPIITGSALAYWSGTFILSIALLALLTAAALQILSNLGMIMAMRLRAVIPSNDWGHYEVYKKELLAWQK